MIGPKLAQKTIIVSINIRIVYNYYVKYLLK